MVDQERICVLGCGDVFENIAADYSSYHISSDKWEFRAVSSPAEISISAEQLLHGLSPEELKLFIAVDYNALNYARLELYYVAKLKGYRFATLVHHTASCNHSKIGENVWVGPCAYAAPQTVIGSNVMLNAYSRIDQRVEIGSHVWVGAGSSISKATTIGSHTVIGNNVNIGEGLSIGKHCLINKPGSWQTNMPNGSFLESVYTEPARMVGSGYSSTIQD